MDYLILLVSYGILWYTGMFSSYGYSKFSQDFVDVQFSTALAWFSPLHPTGQVLLERIQTALIQAAVTAAKQSLPGATHEEADGKRRWRLCHKQIV